MAKYVKYTKKTEIKKKKEHISICSECLNKMEDPYDILVVSINGDMPYQTFIHSGCVEKNPEKYKKNRPYKVFKEKEKITYVKFTCKKCEKISRRKDKEEYTDWDLTCNFCKTRKSLVKNV